MATTLNSVRALEPVLAQGRIERTFVGWLEACTKKAEFEQARQQPDWNSYPLLLGGLVDRVFKHELSAILGGRGFTLDLGDLVRNQIAGDRRYTALDDGTSVELIKQSVQMIRGWTERFDWPSAVLLERPNFDYFVRRPGRFAIRVKPDAVVGVDDTIVCVEATTAKDRDYVSPARFALNWWALLRERLRRPEWAGYQKVITHVELLALGESFAVELSVEQAESWRESIGNVAEDLLASRYEPNRGPHCTTCFFQSACWFGNQPGRKDDF